MIYPLMQAQPEIHDPFRAVLRPNRSLGPDGFMIVMAGVGLISFVAGVAFLLIGAWPVLGFFGLDAALVYWAFRRNFRDAERREIIEVTPYEVIVQRITPGKEIVEQRFNRPWVRAELEYDNERELVGPLRLCQSGRYTEIASFLGPEDRTGFYQALSRAMA